MNDSKLSFISLWKLNDWGKYNRRDEAILWELSRRDDVSAVLHVEHISLKGLLYNIIQWFRERDKTMKKIYLYHVIKGLSFKPVKVDNNKKYFIYSIVIIYSGKNLFLKKINRLLMKMQYIAINRYFVKSNGKTVLIAYPPSIYLEYAVENIKHNLLIADFEDDTAERKTDEREKKQVLEIYKKILPQCEWIFSTSPSINQKYRELAGKDIDFLPNGVDLHNFLLIPQQKPMDKKNLKTVGYVGIINREIDIDLLVYILTNHPQAHIVLVGLATDELLPEIKRLTKKYNNLHYLGERNYRDIPHYIANFDVLINIKKNDFTTAGGESQKIYEYLLTGKPIVSTPVPPADRYRNLIYVASDKYQFANFLKTALEEDNGDLRQQRIQKGINNSWANRVDIIMDWVSRYFN